VSVTATLDALAITAVAPRAIGRVAHFANGVVEARGLGLAVGSGARIARASGAWSPAIVAGFSASHLQLAPLDGASDFAAGARVEPCARATSIAVGDALRGRVIDALGDPLDDGGAIVTPARAMLTPLPALQRAGVDVPFATGVRAIDALLTMGRGQRVALIAGSGVGKSTLLDMILRGARADVAVVALVGERGREIAEFVARLRADPVAARRTIVVAAPADAPAILRLRAIERASAIAGWYRAQGQHALLVADSLTRVAHAQRELGLALGEPPTMKGYPPSALALLPRLVEAAGGDARSGGAVTAVYTVLADGDDLDDPVVDTVRGAVDGHIMLSRQLADSGVFPAIDLARSLSRTMAAVTSAAARDVARTARQLWVVAAENRDLALIGGAYRAGTDALLDRAFAARDALATFVAQPVEAPPVTLAQAQADVAILVRSL